jgi:hypothetical protein
MEFSKKVPGLRFLKRGLELIMDLANNMFMDMVVGCKTIRGVIRVQKRTGGMPRSSPTGFSG